MAERGRILRTLQRFDDAISDLSKAAELAPDDFTARLELGRTYLASSNLDAAVVNLLEAERLSPHDPELCLALAQTDVARGQNDAALERLRSLLTVRIIVTVTDCRRPDHSGGTAAAIKRN
ncbi:MAG: tetratricopeptide repeat protein [Planctomycetaceae bacterium]